MPAESLSKPKRGRGRPKCDAERLDVALRLLTAAEHLLSGCSHVELTERSIAASAGVDESMIRYYFGGKDGLLAELLIQHCVCVEYSLAPLDSFVPGSRPVTHFIIEVLTDAYYQRPNITRVLVAEITRKNSVIRDLYQRKFGARGVGLDHLQGIIERLMGAGIFRQTLDPTLTAYSLLAIINAPFTLAPLANNDGSKPELKNQRWIDHLIKLFEAVLLP